MIETVLPIGGCRNTLGYAIIRPRKENSPVPPPPVSGYKIYYTTVDGSSLTSHTDLSLLLEGSGITANYIGPTPDFSVPGEITYSEIPEYLGAVIDDDFTNIDYGPLFTSIPEIFESRISSITFSPGITSLKGINIEATIGVCSYNNHLKTVTLPEGLLEIGFGSFTNCPALGSVNIPDSVTSLDEEAFWGCESDLIITCAGTDYDWVSGQETITIVLGNGESQLLRR